MKKTGFTIIELLVASAAAVIIGLSLVSILVNNNGFFYKQTSIVNEGLDINDTLSNITTNIQQASMVATGYPEASPLYTTGAGTLVLKLPSTSVNGIIDKTYDFIVISRDQSKPKILRMQTFPDPGSTRRSTNLVLTTLLQDIQFAFYDKDDNVVSPTSAVAVGTTLTVLSKTGSSSSQRTAYGKTTLRNFAQ